MNKHKVGKYNVWLSALYGEYNCGNKTVGRLQLHVNNGDDPVDVGSGVIAKELEDPKIRDAIIFNYLEDLNQRATFKALKDGCPFFPLDSGVYPPGVLIYCDAIHMNKSFTWYNHWKGLIEVFETEPKFGVVVLKSPILPNRYYGPSKPSRIWTLVLPSIAKDICFDKASVTPGMKVSLSAIAKNYAHSPILKHELTTLGIA